MIDTRELVSRLEKVERQNRWMKVVGGAVLLVMAGLVVIVCAMPGPKVLEVEGIIVKDSDGKERVRLGLESLRFFDSDGLILTDLSMGLLSLYAMEGERRFSVNSTRLRFEDNKGVERTTLGSSSRYSGPYLRLFDENAYCRAVFGSTSTEIIEDGSEYIYPLVGHGYKSPTKGEEFVQPSKNGDKHAHPESSLVLCDNEGKVVYKGP